MDKETKQHGVNIDDLKKSVDNFSNIMDNMLEVCISIITKALPIEYSVWLKRFSILVAIQTLINTDKVAEAVNLYDEFNDILNLTEKELGVIKK